MNNLLFLCFFSIIAVEIRAQSTIEDCLTPDQRNGVCTYLAECDSLYKIISKKVLFTNERILLEQSKCGDLENYVCCPDEKVMSTAERSIIRISAQKCNEYADFAYNKSYTMNPLGNSTVIKMSNCAFTSVGLVLGGVAAQPREFPHMALIGFGNVADIHWECGGTLISELFVLSAYHCNEHDHGPAKHVRLGEHNLSQTSDATHIDYKINETFSRNVVPPKTYNDIILFKLDRKVEFDHVIRPACLPTQSNVPEKVIACGWGNVEFGGRRSDILQKVVLETFSKSEWSNTDVGRSHSRFREGTIVYAGSHNASKDTCQGDSGGPIQIIDLDPTHHCTYIVVGVTSNGGICGVIGTPAVYTSVFAHLQWIEDTVWPNE